MANLYCTSAEYPAVRAAIDTTLTDALLPDATIALAPYAADADREVKRRVPTHATLAADPDRLAQLKLAAILLCAARLTSALPSITEEGVGQRDYTYKALVATPAERAKALRAQAGEAIADLNGATGMPTFFAVAAGGRAASTARVILPLPDNSVIVGQG